MDRDLVPGVCASQVPSAPFVQCCRGGLWEGYKPSWWMVSGQASMCARLLTHWFLHSPQICGCCAPLVFLYTRTLEPWDVQVASVHRCTALPASFTLDCKRLSSLQLG